MGELGQCLAGRRVVVLGAGASVDRSWDEIAALVDDGAAVLACDRIAAAAAERMAIWGLVSLDADPLATMPIATALAIDPEIYCLIASICDPAVADEVLRGYTFLPAMGEFEEAFDASKADAATVAWCGSNVTVCTVTLAMILGAREIDVYGFDGRLDRGDYSKDVLGRGEPRQAVEMLIDGELVLSTFAFATFVTDMIEIERLGRANGLLERLTVHGEGSLYSLLRPAQMARLALHEKLIDGTYRKVAMPCLCGSTDDGSPVANVDRDGFAHPMVMCDDCGLIRARERLDDAALGAFYRDDYRAVYGKGPADPFRCELGLNMVALAEMFHFRLDRVFEVGAGNGEFLDALPPGDVRLGSDHDPGTKWGALSGVPAAEYDLVAFHHSLEHVTDPAGELRAAREMLAPGGVIYVGLPGLHRHEKRMLWQLAHLWQFEAKTLRAFMEREGFESIYIDEGICSLWRPV